jgi:hypothetical protein
MRPHIVRALSDVLQRQHRVISSRQIVDAGCDHELATREVAAGRWQKPAYGVYFAFPEPPTLLQRAWCAQLIGGDRSVVSGALACQLLGVADAPAVTAVALVPAACRRRGTADYVVRRTARLPTHDDCDGLRVAPAERAVVDAARLTPDLRGVRALICAALNGKHTSYAALLAERTAEPRAGLALLKQALADWAAGARSAPEAEVADALRDEVRAGRLPPFLLNANVFEGPVLLGAPDVYVPGRALGNETDSRRHHGSEADLDATLSRHAVFFRAGLQLEHVTPSRFRQNPQGWAALFSAIAQQRVGMGDPAGLRIEPVGPLQDGRRRR